MHHQHQKTVSPPLVVPSPEQEIVATIPSITETVVTITTHCYIDSKLSPPPPPLAVPPGQIQSPTMNLWISQKMNSTVVVLMKIMDFGFNTTFVLI